MMLKLSIKMFIALVMVMAVNQLARADQWQKSYQVGSNPQLQIKAGDATIHVTGWQQNTIDAQVTTENLKIDPSELQIIEHQTGDRVEIELKLPHIFHHNNYSATVEVHMPMQALINLHTGDGNITVDQIKGDLTLFTGDGDINADKVDGKLNASSGDGQISIDGRFDLLNIHTGDGGVKAVVQHGSQLSSGWRLQSGDGDLDMRLPSELAADVDLHTGDGEINIETPISVNGSVRSNMIRGKINGGGAELNMHTGDGSIHIAAL